MENQTTSALQQQFPLSSKKFWKKMIGDLFCCFILAILGLGVSIFINESLIWAIFAGALFLLIMYLLARIWYVKTYIRRYFYSASDDFITIKKGVFAPAEIHVQYQKIQDVYVDQDIVDRILGIYDVHIASATVASGIEAHIDGVEEAAADGLKELFLGKLRSGGSSGTGGASASASPTQAMPQQEAAKPLDASQMISSEQYPIQPQWMRLQIVNALFHALWLSVFLAIYVGFDVGIATGVGIAAFLVIFFIQVSYNIIWKKNFHFAFLQDYVQFSTQVITKSEQHMPYRTIQDVIVNQGVIERLFGLSTVFIQNAAMNQPTQRGRKGTQGGVRIPGQTLESANKIAEIVRSITLTKNPSGTGL